MEFGPCCDCGSGIYDIVAAVIIAPPLLFFFYGMVYLPSASS